MSKINKKLVDADNEVAANLNIFKQSASSEDSKRNRPKPVEHQPFKPKIVMLKEQNVVKVGRAAPEKPVAHQSISDNTYRHTEGTEEVLIIEESEEEITVSNFDGSQEDF